MKGLQELSSHFKERTLTKYYICIVAGKVDKRQLIKGYLYKDKKLNKVTICQTLPRAGPPAQQSSTNRPETGRSAAACGH